MARTLLVVMGQKPVAYTDEAELTFPHATSDMWPAPFNFGKDVALFRHPSSGQIVLNEKAAFEAWLEADYSPDRSGATSDLQEQFFLALCWHIWLARAALAEPAKEQQHSSAIIQSEVADFFAGFVAIHTELNGPNTIEEAQVQLSARLCAILAAPKDGE